MNNDELASQHIHFKYVEQKLENILNTPFLSVFFFFFYIILYIYIPL